MKTQFFYHSLMAVVLMAAAVSVAEAVSLPIVNPGFDSTVLNAEGFIFEDVSYFQNDPMPDHTFTLEDISGNGDEISAIGDSATGAQIFTDPPTNAVPAAVGIVGYTGSPGSGVLRDSRDFLPGNGPTGPGAYISYADANPRGIFQTLVGTQFQPNTTYTFTAEVSDRRFGPEDNVAFPSGGTVVPTGIHLSLAGSLGGEQTTGVFTFTQPPAGGTSLATLVFTTGPAGSPTPSEPMGDITLVIRTQGHNPGPLTAATQVVFDNLMLDASPAGSPLTDADFDGDGDVDGADFLIWQRGVGSGTSQSQGDANFSGAVDGVDLGIWKTEFGTPQSLVATTAIPEPASCALSLVALVGAAATRRRLGRGRSMTNGV